MRPLKEVEPKLLSSAKLSRYKLGASMASRKTDFPSPHNTIADGLRNNLGVANSARKYVHPIFH